MTSAFHVYFGPEALTAPINVRRIGPRDCVAALREGLDDFVAMLTHVAFLGLFYALGGSRSRRCRRSATPRISCSRSPPALRC
jgi:hypothetical protein